LYLGFLLEFLKIDAYNVQQIKLEELLDLLHLREEVGFQMLELRKVSGEAVGM
jgi:hypothetical protein